MINGQIYRGANGCAGEWLFSQEDDPLPAYIETYNAGLWALDLGVALRTQMRLKDETVSSKVRELVKGDIKKITFPIVVKAAEAGDAIALEIIRDAGKRLGRKAAFLANLFNPEILVIGGGIETAGAVFLDAVRDAVKLMAVPEATDRLRILPASLGENGVPLGAAALVAQNYFVNV
jgi:predicted NBD/HSP70 family sugar kinase